MKVTMKMRTKTTTKEVMTVMKKIWMTKVPAAVVARTNTARNNSHRSNHELNLNFSYKRSHRICNLRNH
jgi:hypothetical protein